MRDGLAQARIRQQVQESAVLRLYSIRHPDSDTRFLRGSGRRHGERADDMRVLDLLIGKARGWVTAPGSARIGQLAVGAELELFRALGAKRNDWLSPGERAFIAASHAA
jgi:hypothetical protein